MTFAVAAAVRADPCLARPLLVAANGRERAVRYAVSARRASSARPRATT